MRTATYRFVDGPFVQTGTIFLGVDDHSWNWLFGPLGVHAPCEFSAPMWDAYSLRITSGVRLENGLFGGVRFDLLEFDFGEPVLVPNLPGVTAIRAVGTKLVIGGDGQRHCIPVGHAIRVRFAVGAGVPAGDPFMRWSLSPRTRIAPGVYAEPAVTMRRAPEPKKGLDRADTGFDARSTPLGERYGWLDPGIGGGWAIDFQPGYQDDRVVDIRRCDAMMNPFGFDAFSRDGSLIEAVFPAVDGWWFGWRPWQQPTGFTGVSNVEPEHDPAICAPRWWNDGPSSYEAFAAGQLTYRDSEMANLEHLRRITGPLEVCCEVHGDKLAAIDRRVLAQAMEAVFEYRIGKWADEAEGRFNGKGHEVLGGRGLSWLADLLYMEPTTRSTGRVLARAIARVQMPNGFCNSKPWPTGGSPDPHVEGPEIKKPLRKTSNSAQGMEQIITDYVLARAGEIDAARLHLDRLFRTTVAWWGRGPLRGMATDPCIFDRAGGWRKFYGVTDGGAVVRRVNEWTDGSDYFGLVAAALGMFLSRDRDLFRAAMLRMPSPNKRPLGTTAEALRVFVLPDELGREQTALCASALETFG